MKVSKSELIYVLKQAFEGCGYDFGACQNMAEQIVWSEMRGFRGLTILERLISEGISAPSTEFDIHTLDGDELRFDAAGSSLLYQSDLGVSLAIANCKSGSSSKLVFENCRDGALVLNKLAEMSLNGLASFVCEIEFNSEKKISRWARCDQLTGAIRVCDGFKETDELAEPKRFDLILYLCSSGGELDQFISQQAFELEQIENGEEIAANYQSSLAHGIEVSDKVWRCLNKIGSKVLVESTEASRKGAGA